MNVLERYIINKIIYSILIVALILTGLELLISFVNELRDFGHGYYGLVQLIFYVFLSLPQNVYSLMPMIGLLGCLIGLGALAHNSELVAMRAAGFSEAQIIKAVIKGALIIVVFMTLVGELISPLAKHMAEEYKYTTLSGGQALKTQHGVWVRDGESFIHIDRVQSDGVLSGVTIYSFDKNHHLLNSYFAEKALYKEKHWILYDVNQSNINIQGVTTLKTAEIQWHTDMKPNLLNIAEVEPEEMNLLELYAYINYRKANGLGAESYALSFWRRMAQPFATLIMILLGLPFIFKVLRSLSLALRLMTGVMIGFAFYILNGVLGTLSLVFQLPPVLGAVVPLAFFAWLGYFLTKRTKFLS